MDSCNYFYGGMVRIYNKEDEFMKGYIIIGIIFNSIFGYILCFILKLGVLGNVITFLVSYILLFIFLNYLYFFKIHNKKFVNITQ